MCISTFHETIQFESIHACNKYRYMKSIYSISFCVGWIFKSKSKSQSRNISAFHTKDVEQTEHLKVDSKNTNSGTSHNIKGIVLFQFFADADDVDTWMLDTLRLVSSEDVGRDEASVQSLLKKHKVSGMITKFLILSRHPYTDVLWKTFSAPTTIHKNQILSYHIQNYTNRLNWHISI